MDVIIVPIEVYAFILDAILFLLIAGILLACLCQSCNVSCSRMVSYLWLKFSTRVLDSKLIARLVAFVARFSRLVARSKPVTLVVAAFAWLAALAKIPSIS